MSCDLCLGSQPSRALHRRTERVDKEATGRPGRAPADTPTRRLCPLPAPSFPPSALSPDAEPIPSLADSTPPAPAPRPPVAPADDDADRSSIEVDIRASEKSSGLAAPKAKTPPPADNERSSLPQRSRAGTIPGAPETSSNAADPNSDPKPDPSAPKEIVRETFEAAELAIVLSHFELGPLRDVREFPRGSRRAPKLLVRGRNEDYLLKRRARGKDDPYKVAFCHAIQMHLAQRQFPLPHLIGTRDTNNSMLQHQKMTYELFEFIRGTTYDQTRESTLEAGKILGLFHKLLRDFETQFPSARGTYHASRTVASALNRIPDTLAKTDPKADAAAYTAAVQHLHESYLNAVKRVEMTGLNDWPTQIIHTDWHPGNMLFRGSRVVAVIDYDAARYAQRMIDVANGALQFSILGSNADPDSWPTHIDEKRFLTFLSGYDSVPDAVLSVAELQTIPWLMIEALIAECAIPIAATGKFSRLPGATFLQMVSRKVRWMQDNADRLIKLAEG